MAFFIIEKLIQSYVIKIKNMAPEVKKKWDEISICTIVIFAEVRKDKGM
jgi:hypothetical protein